MDSSEPGEVSQILQALRAGDAEAQERLLPRVEAELSRLAQEQLRRFRRRTGGGEDAELDTVVLINEAYLQLVREKRDWQDRAHFFAIAANRMRNIAVDHARRVLAEKRGGAVEKVALEAHLAVPQQAPLDPSQLVDLDRALERLAALDPRQARIVELRFFAGLNDAEIAVSESISESTVKREWRLARAWLFRELKG